MQCPSCRNEIADNQFYCPVCRASVYSYTPENSPGGGKRKGKLPGRWLLEALLILILIGVGIVLARAIKWKELMNNFLPGFVTAPAENSGTAPGSPPASSGKKSAAKPVKSPEEKPPADPNKPTSTESVRDMNQKIEEFPAPGESKPTPKPTAQPTPKPPSNNN